MFKGSWIKTFNTLALLLKEFITSLATINFHLIINEKFWVSLGVLLANLGEVVWLFIEFWGFWENILEALFVITQSSRLSCYHEMMRNFDELQVPSPSRKLSFKFSEAFKVLKKQGFQFNWFPDKQHSRKTFFLIFGASQAVVNKTETQYLFQSLSI